MRQLDVVHQHHLGAVKLHEILDRAFHVAPLMQRAPVDQYMPAHRGPYVVHVVSGPLERGAVKHLALFQRGHRLARRDRHERRAEIRAPHFQRHERDRLAVLDRLTRHVQRRLRLAVARTPADRDHPAPRQSDATAAPFARRVPHRQHRRDGADRLQLLRHHRVQRIARDTVERDDGGFGANWGGPSDNLAPRGRPERADLLHGLVQVAKVFDRRLAYPHVAQHLRLGQRLGDGRDQRGAAFIGLLPHDHVASREDGAVL